MVLIMGKCYIEFKKVKNKNGEAEFKNIKLKIDGLLIKRSFSIENEEKLIEDLKNKNVTYEKKNGKRVITDKDLVLKYSKKAKEVLKQNKYKKAIFTTATISKATNIHIIHSKISLALLLSINKSLPFHFIYRKNNKLIIHLILHIHNKKRK